jgi:hypothetical protein
MNSYPLCAIIVSAGVLAAQTVPAQPAAAPIPAPAATNAPQPLGPRMKFLTNEYDFGKIVSGEQVKYAFVVSNAGDQTLVISRVAPGCHCTSVLNHCDKVEPGKTGEISLQFDSGAFHGPITRSIAVTSNDKIAPVQTVYLKGTIWRPIEVNPQFAYITVGSETASNASTIVHISVQYDKPVTLSDPTSVNGAFKAELKPITPGKEYDLTIYAMPPLPPGSTTGTIAVKTSLTNMPVLNVTTIAIVQPSVTVSPLQIALSPLIDKWTTNSVLISSTGNKILALSDPVASDERVKLEIKEITPGRTFQLLMAVPPGFQLAPGHDVEVKVKTNKPDHPLVTVPIYQIRQNPVQTPVGIRPKVISQQNPPQVFQATGHP